MRKTRVYVDTSVFGGVHDEEFARPSRRFFERLKAGQFTMLVSASAVAELRRAPERVRAVYQDIGREHLEFVPFDDEVKGLSDAYIAAGVVGVGRREDANHVAAASVAGADIMLSWNFEHIVRYDRVQKFNGVNVLKGYRPLAIVSPLEVEYDQED